MKGTRRGFIGAAAMVLASGLVGCADGRTSNSDSPASVPATAVPTPVAPSNIQVFGPAPQGANEVNNYSSIAEAVNDPEVISIVGVAVDAKVTQVFKGETADSGLIMIGVVVRPEEQLTGKELQAGDIMVEFIGPSTTTEGPNDGAEAVAAYKDAAVKLGRSIWILGPKDDNSKGYYALASSQCLFSEVAGKVRNPSYDDELAANNPFVEQAMGFSSLDAMAAAMVAAYKG